MTTMTDGWKTKLHALSDLQPDRRKLRALVESDRRPLSDVSDAAGSRNRLVAGIVALVVFAGAFSLVWIGIGDPFAGPVDARSSQPTEPGPPASSGQVIGYHGLVLTVPASWAINDERCGTPSSDTVLRDLGGIRLCLNPRPTGIDSVELVEDPGRQLQDFRGTDSFTNPNGVKIEQGRVPDEPGTAIYVPDVDVLMLIDTVSETRAEAIVDSIELSNTDPAGCAMREMQLDPPASSEPLPAMHEMLIPGSPSAIAICHYGDNWLLSSAKLTGDELSRFVSVVNGLAEGSVHAPADSYDPSFCDEPSTEGGERGSGYIVWVFGIDPAPVPLWAHVGICGDLGIANGAREGQLTPEVAKLLNEPLHHGYVMPGRLVPGPSAS
jgi:hypothetical protein